MKSSSVWPVLWSLALLCLATGCNRESHRLIYLSAERKIEDGLYVVVHDHNVKDGEITEKGMTQIKFDKDHIAKVKSFSCFDSWHTSEFLSADRSESLPIGFGTPASIETRACWSLGRGKDKLWLFVGTGGDLETFKKTRRHQLGDYTLELPPQ